MAHTEYCTMDEACEMLGKTDTEIKAMVADGRLHELRDAGKIFFKREEVKRIAAKEGSSIVDLAAAEDMSPQIDGEGQPDSFASALSSLADESSSLGVLEANTPSPGVEELMAKDPSPPLELDAETFPQDLPAAAREDEIEIPELSSEIDLLPTAEGSSMGLSPVVPEAKAPAGADLEVPDLGLSGSSIISLETTGLDLDEPAAPPKPAAKDSGKAGKVGISVFDDDELKIDVDPMGETRISAGVAEMETVGSGSGLLDLTQESDDTSLGAALLDVISPTEAAETQTEEAVEVIEAAETISESSGGTRTLTESGAEYVTTTGMAPAMAARSAVSTSMAGAVPMNITLVLGIISLALIGLATAAQLQGVWPATILSPIAKNVVHWAVFGGLAAIALGTGIWGILAGRK